MHLSCKPPFKGRPILGDWWTLWIVMKISSRVLPCRGDFSTAEVVNIFNSKLMVESGSGIATATQAPLVTITSNRAQQEKARALKSRQS